MSFLGKALLVIASFMLLPFAGAQSQPVVYGVFFHSPTCPFCHVVMDDHWPGIQAEFGDQLRVLFVDASTPQGGQLYHSAINNMGIASRGVPMLIIGETVLTGAADIPNQTPDLVRNGLAAGGIDYPPIPDVESYFERASVESNPAFVLPSVETASVSATGTTETAAPVTTESTSILDDPANVVAIGVLLGLIGVMGLVGLVGWRLVVERDSTLLRKFDARLGRNLALASAVLGVALSGSLILGSFDNLTTLILAAGVLVIFAVLTVQLLRADTISGLTGMLIPLILFAGLLVAGYLAYVETTLSDAMCGVIGNCNVVQQSEHATMFGVPVGVLGVVGYLSMIGVWALGRTWDEKQSSIALLLMALVGMVFSIYLTFLEPFVIGASCVWCLTSAVVMAMVLLLIAPAGWRALRGNS
ncbi:MAG: vitamin K epoxide reductase family protein [Anaerolineaceae bacterium]|nr:MAG: vitamin K epoxide reductase family protein [Anaerolineaceae bacterium]